GARPADGKKTEAAPWLAEFGLAECPEPGFKARSVANVRDSDGSDWFGDWHTAGGRATLDACRILGRPFLIVYRRAAPPSPVAASITEKNIRVLNCAGNREVR